MPITYFTLPFIWRDESSPLCRRVADTPRHLCSWSSSYCLISLCPFGLPPVYYYLDTFSSFHITLSSRISLIFLNQMQRAYNSFLLFILHTGPLLVALLSYNSFPRLSHRLKDSLLGAILTLSGKLFNFSTTRTVNECFLMSVRVKWTPSPWCAVVSFAL